MFYQWDGENLILNCRIQPKSSNDSFAEVIDGSIKIRITAPPVDGKANLHLIKFLARQFKTTQDDIHIVRGQNSRMKTVRIHKPGRLPVELGLTDQP